MKKLLIQEDVPRWYHLFWNKEKQGLFIRIHRFFLENCEIKNFEPYFRDFITTPSYLPLFDKCESRLGQSYFGINDSITLVEQDGEWMTYRVKVPCVHHESRFVCKTCEGTGKRQPEHLFKGVCYACNGRKTDSFLDYIAIDETCFSLSLLFKALRFSFGDSNIPTASKQLFTITSLTNVGRDGHAVGGYTSPEFIRFMESFITSQNKEFRFPSVVTVMRSVQSRLRSKDRTDRFACYTRVGQTHFDCPGNACHLSIEWSRIIGYTSGGEISCHNLDGATQQLMLLCGLAELASLYDEWIAGKK